MDCGACTKVLAKRLTRILDVATDLAVVTHDGTRDLSQELIDAVDDVGYRATIVR